jgi:hypothetical protein
MRFIPERYAYETHITFKDQYGEAVGFSRDISTGWTDELIDRLKILCSFD